LWPPPATAAPGDLLDPRLSDSGVLADEWVPVGPGTDVALVAAMAYVMERDGLVDRDFLASHTTGYEAYRRYVLGTADLGAADLGAADPCAEDACPKSPQGRRPSPACRRLLSRAWPAPTPRSARGAAGRLGAAAVDLWRAGGRAFITLACMSGNVGLPGGGVAPGQT
jgi:hypothetical protein